MKEYIREVALYIIDNHTIIEASNHFNKSISSIKKYLAKVRDTKSLDYDPILAEKLRLAQCKICLEASKRGGANGKRSKTISDEDLRKYAENYLTGKTYEELASETHIPKSTLQENIRKIDDLDLQVRLDEVANKR